MTWARAEHRLQETKREREAGEGGRGRGSGDGGRGDGTVVELEAEGRGVETEDAGGAEGTEALELDSTVVWGCRSFWKLRIRSGGH